jgi:hypothetical protein
VVHRMRESRPREETIKEIDHLVTGLERVLCRASPFTSYKPKSSSTPLPSTIDYKERAKQKQRFLLLACRKRYVGESSVKLFQL